LSASAELVFVCHAPSLALCSFEVAYFEEALWVDFDAVYQIFFGMGCRFRSPKEFSFFSIDGATIIAKLRSEIVKSPKIGGKGLCAQLRVDSRANSKNSRQ